MNYYIDESGNTGDLSLSATDMQFGGQPVFTLAALGIVDSSVLTIALNEFRRKYDIKSQELKLSSIYRRKPEFILEVVNYLISIKVPFFIEVVDKKYLLAANITNNFVWPPYFNIKESQRTVFLKNEFSDFIYHYFANHVFLNFLEVIKSPSNDSVANFFDLLSAEVKCHDHEIMQYLCRCIVESKDDFYKVIEMENENAYKRFLPIPNEGKKGQCVWILPNFSCFTNIYARINRYQEGDLSSCRIIHDEQIHFDEIIKESKEQVESFDTSQTNYVPPLADYGFRETADLFFKSSSDTPGIQAADILAGLAMRYYLKLLRNETPLDVEKKSIDELINHSKPSRGVGINLVTSRGMADIFSRASC